MTPIYNLNLIYFCWYSCSLGENRCSFIIVLILSVVSLLVVVEGQQTQQSSPQAKVPQLPIRTTTQSTAEEASALSAHHTNSLSV